MRAALALLVSVAGCSPFGGGAFRCETDADCAGGPSAGRCETTVGYCSFEDSACQSGRRYGTASGAQSGVCVGEEVPIDAQPTTDADLTIDMAPGDARLCFGTPHEVCLMTLPSGPRTLPTTIDTDVMCDQVESPAGGVPLCVVSGAQITINDTRAQGSRPLVIVATETITITGNLDVGSKRGTTPGAGANSAACQMNAIEGEDDGGGGGGGGGGGFGANGGNAGLGDTNRSNGGGAGTEATGGTGGAMSISAFIRGGCRGGDGGSTNGDNNGADQGDNHGPGANGGGAVYLIAGTSITVQTGGAIYASGAGGTGGQEFSGAGGGGGSGGLVGLDAPAIVVMGHIAANGGGGGGGAGNTDAGNGGDGAQVGTPAAWNQRGAGGTGGEQNPAANTRGGLGGATGNLAGEVSPASPGGSGGGGGGVGVIWVRGTLTGTQLSPPMTAH
ncbi:MAG: hypothetical protein ACKV2T_41705 [Kofleriaceae bacterium]